MHLSGVRLSVWLSHPATHTAAVGPAGRRYRSVAAAVAAWWANVGSAMLLAYIVAGS